MKWFKGNLGGNLVAELVDPPDNVIAQIFKYYILSGYFSPFIEDKRFFSIDLIKSEINNELFGGK